MKFSTLFFALTAVCGTVAVSNARASTTQEASATLAWRTDFEQAQKDALAQNKPLFVYFTGSDWCPWCKKMDAQILSTPEFQKALSDKLIFVKVDFPRNTKLDPALEAQNKRLSKTYEIQGFPTAILLDPNGKRIEKLGFENGGGAAYAKKVEGIIDAYNKK